MTLTPKKTRFDRRYLAIAVVFVIALYVILPQLGDFKTSRHLLSHPNWLHVFWAVVFMSLTYLAAAATYCLLAFHSLRYWRSVVVQLAAMFVNRLLPSGIGALGANFIYLKHNKHSSAQAGTVVGVNNLLGFMGHGILSILVVLVYSGNGATLDHSKGHTWVTFIRYGAGIGFLLLSAALVFGQNRFNKAIKDVAKQLFNYRRRPLNVFCALLTSMALTACNVLCLYSCMGAIGVHLSIFAVFLIFSFAVGAGTITPTPGGLGGYEAALVAGFVAYGVVGSTALAIALFYRLISYWLALLVGGIAFVVTQRRGYI